MTIAMQQIIAKRANGPVIVNLKGWCSPQHLRKCIQIKIRKALLNGNQCQSVSKVMADRIHGKWEICLTSSKISQTKDNTKDKRRLNYFYKSLEKPLINVFLLTYHVKIVKIIQINHLKTKSDPFHLWLAIKRFNLENKIKIKDLSTKCLKISTIIPNFL